MARNRIKLRNCLRSHTRITAATQQKNTETHTRRSEQTLTHIHTVAVLAVSDAAGVSAVVALVVVTC